MKKEVLAAALLVTALCFGGCSAKESPGGDMAAPANDAASQSEESSEKDVISSAEDKAKETIEKIENDASVPKENRAALIKAEQYSDIMHMSKQGIYDQLTSDYGEQFTADEAQYAINNLSK